MEKILRENEINVVISAVGGTNILDQIPLVKAIESVPSVKVHTYICNNFHLCGFIDIYEYLLAQPISMHVARNRGFWRRSLGMTWTGRTRWSQG